MGDTGDPGPGEHPDAARGEPAPEHGRAGCPELHTAPAPRPWRRAVLRNRTDCTITATMGEEAIRKHRGSPTDTAEQIDRLVEFAALDHIHVLLVPTPSARCRATSPRTPSCCPTPSCAWRSPRPRRAAAWAADASSLRHRRQCDLLCPKRPGGQSGVTKPTVRVVACRAD
ncbi:Scr1 family TA system antitoxin-like transcriptional regulator [Actinokineospora spheciospongiae]|uniref:Scr1 family TA system antitoxin-like transcriptional regulator n=1 Tax=Actinokineospora spheciospongiae TaxID=909613 RepID=UPI001C643F48